MSFIPQPWSVQPVPEGAAFGPGDCLLGEFSTPITNGLECSVLMRGAIRDHARELVLFPYPKRDSEFNPPREGFPVRPRKGHNPISDAETAGAAALQRMNEVLARIQELEEALEDPSDVWSKLREAWKRAENEADPRMAEIVRQAHHLQPKISDLMSRIRRVLRRHRKMTPLDRVQEMDRSSMIWFSRQPGRNIPERAGSSQRILAIARSENFDTLENRVFHAYVRLASGVAHQWLREHPRACESKRYSEVDSFRKSCQSIAKLLTDLGVAVADVGVTPNYVLIEDLSYREVYEAWKRLLRRQMVEDDLWAWQAETWTDFATLAITVAIDELTDAKLVAQSPIIWHSEAVNGRWFEQDRPIVVFWLRQINRIVEVQARPEKPGTLLSAARAHVALRITDPDQNDLSRRVAVWTPHTMERLDLKVSARCATEWLGQLQSLDPNEVLRNGLIVTPAHDRPESLVKGYGSIRVDAIALGASGPSLAHGLAAVRTFTQGEIYQDMA